jgi:diaminohydroxyphosphoribosylaminopyrimidine deaminase/5-amino-6-(5-phosphoribosylamino)uracil reductase
MSLALAEAEKGLGAVEPNPMVGAVVVRDGAVVGRGYHARFGGPHAERVALDEAGEAARGATLYATLEPCCHHGKTPPCTDAILSAGIVRVVAAIRDPFPRVNGGGLNILKAAGIDVELGTEADAALTLNAPYFKRILTEMPYITAKWAMTLDGKTAVAGGDSRWISSARSRGLVHELRGRMDGIVVGIQTALNDDPQLTARPPGPRTPARIILDSKARLPLSSRLIASLQEAPLIVVVTEDAPQSRRLALQQAGCEVLAIEGPGRVPVVPLLKSLGHRDMTNVLVEGGGRVLGAFLDAGQVDELDVYVAPVIEGGEHLQTPARGKGVRCMADAARLRDVRYEEVDGDLRIRGRLPQPWQDRLKSLTEAVKPVHP